jgi:hypothetical protein
MRDPVVGLASGPGRRTDPNLGYYPEFPIPRGQNPTANAHVTPPNPARNIFSGQHEKATSSAKSKGRSGRALIGLSKYENQTMVGQTCLDITNMRKKTPLSPKHKSAGRVYTENQTSHPKQSGPRPPTAQALQAGPPKSLHTRYLQADEKSIAPTERGIGNMGRSMIQGMVSSLGLNESEAATKRKTRR